MNRPGNRRDFLHTAAAAGSLAFQSAATADENERNETFSLRYILASCMYGYADLETIISEVAKTGAAAIDIWPKVHGNQREQVDQMGRDSFRRLLQSQNVSLGCITQYKLGPFGLKDELLFAQRLQCPMIVTGGKGPKGLKGNELKSAVADFVRKMRPHIDAAEAAGVTIAIENHGNNLIESPDSLRWLAELSPSRHLSIALAPYHLPQDTKLLCNLIESLGDSITMFYAWQHGMGCMNAQPKQQELLQMPGRGDLDFAPIVQSLKTIQYDGWTEVFMHPFPRGVPILEPIAAATEEINRSRNYLNQWVGQS